MQNCQNGKTRVDKHGTGKNTGLVDTRSLTHPLYSEEAWLTGYGPLTRCSGGADVDGTVVGGGVVPGVVVRGHVGRSLVVHHGTGPGIHCTH